MISMTWENIIIARTVLHGMENMVSSEIKLALIDRLRHFRIVTYAQNSLDHLVTFYTIYPWSVVLCTIYDLCTHKYIFGFFMTQQYMYACVYVYHFDRYVSYYPSKWFITLIRSRFFSFWFWSIWFWSIRFAFLPSSTKFSMTQAFSGYSSRWYCNCTLWQGYTHATACVYCPRGEVYLL